MHPVQRNFFVSLKNIYPNFFESKRVLDVGSLSINGSIRDLFEDCEYIGLDIAEGKNVDVVSICHKYEPDEKFDVIVSGSALEHDMFIAKTLPHMVYLLKPGGGLFLSAAMHFRKHGLRGHAPNDSATSQSTVKGWADYYKSVSPKIYEKHLKKEDFVVYYTTEARRDARFMGIKIDESGEYPIYPKEDFTKKIVEKITKSQVVVG